MSLRERRDLVALHSNAGAEAEGGALISLVRVAGSSYRRPGAHLLVLRNGRFAGTLSGGCLEADLLRRASWTVRAGAVMEHVSTAFDDTAEIPYGLGCGGEVDLLLEPLGNPAAAALLEAMSQSLQGEQRTVATLLAEGSQVNRLVLDAQGEVLFASGGLSAEEVAELRAALRSTDLEQPGAVHCSRGEFFAERLLPAQRLVIFGAGEDARPLARLAAEIGWSVIVADTRSQRASADRFPSAQAVLVTAAAAGVPVGPEDAVILMTHSYEQDRALLTELLPMAPCYLGVLGARHRSALLLQQAAEAAGLPLSRAVERTHAPVGLQLGGDGPEAVALAIVAELQHTFSKSGANALSRKLTLAEAEDLLANAPAFVPSDACAMYAGEAVTL